MGKLGILRIDELDVEKYKEKRDCYSGLMEYVNGNSDKICALYGLRRTGKSVLMKQCAVHLAKDNKKSIYIECDNISSMDELRPVLEDALNDGVKTVFLDEITAADDFQYNSSFLPNVYVAQGMRIVIAGTDSLNIAFARGEELYDRVEAIHTSYIPYAEYNRLLGKDIDEYIKYGGTLADSTYKSSSQLQTYENTAIVGNILHSIEKNEEQAMFPPALTELYSNKELKSAINKIIDKMCQNVTLKAFNKDYKNSVMSATIRNTKNEHNYKDELDTSRIIEATKRIFEIKNRSEMSTEMSEEHLKEVKDYLECLDLFVRIPSYLSYKKLSRTEDLEIISQTGMVYAHATELMEELKKDENWLKEIPYDDKNKFIDRAEHHVKGIILENEIIANTYRTYNDKNMYISKLGIRENEGGVIKSYEADMIVLDKKAGVCDLFEVKYSDKRDENQIKHMSNERFVEYIEENFGDVRNKFVVYNGDSGICGNISYINAEEYFKETSKSKSWDMAICNLQSKAIESEKVRQRA